MSYSSHRRAALDSATPFPRRVSHLRSCARIVSEKLGVARSEIVARVAIGIQVDIATLGTEEEIARALDCLERMRMGKRIE